MPTFIYSKEHFLDFIKNQVKKDEVVVITNELTGNCSISKKKGIQVTHSFNDETFKDQGIGHIAFRETSSISMLIAKKIRLSKKALDAMKEVEPAKTKISKP